MGRRSWEEDYVLKQAFSALVPAFDPRPGRSNVSQIQDFEVPPPGAALHGTVYRSCVFIHVLVFVQRYCTTSCVRTGIVSGLRECMRLHSPLTSQQIVGPLCMQSRVWAYAHAFLYGTICTFLSALCKVLLHIICTCTLYVRV